MVDFPDGPVVENPTAKAGDTGSIPGPGRFHMPRATKTMHHSYRNPHALESVPCAMRNLPMGSPRTTTRESPHAAMKNRRSQNINEIINFKTVSMVTEVAIPAS